MFDRHKQMPFKHNSSIFKITIDERCLRIFGTTIAQKGDREKGRKGEEHAKINNNKKKIFAVFVILKISRHKLTLICNKCIIPMIRQ